MLAGVTIDGREFYPTALSYVQQLTGPPMTFVCHIFFILLKGLSINNNSREGGGGGVI